MTMTIARWKITVQAATEPATDPIPYAPTHPSTVERAAHSLSSRRNYEQQREEVFRWRQLHGVH